MKVEDLMIGDLVHITEPDEYNGYNAKVKIVNSETGYITVFIDGGVLHDVLCDDLTPIPLTEEILKNNGFVQVKWERDSWECNELSGIDVRIMMNGLPIWGGGDQDHVYINCEYVHKLQHYLKDLEIDKEIEL